MFFDGYTEDESGLREVGRLPTLQAVCMEAAATIAARANMADPGGQYRIVPADVPSGWELEDRAGARVVQTRPSRRSGRVLIHSTREV